MNKRVYLTFSLGRRLSQQRPNVRKRTTHAHIERFIYGKKQNKNKTKKLF